MKKIIHEIIIVIAIVFAMYLISSSNLYKDSYSENKFKSTSKLTKETEIIDDNLLQANRVISLNSAHDELKLYSLYKNNKLIKAVEIKIDEKYIDVNTANSYQLTFLKGIGKALSKRIVDYRINNGIFYEFNDLTKVKGIGEKKLANILNK